MLKKSPVKTRKKRLRMEQKKKLSTSINIKRMSSDSCRGVIAIYSTKNAYVRNRSLQSVYQKLKRRTKKLGLCWIKPVSFATKTTIGEKRMGKGKGRQITFNQTCKIKEGKLLFEIGYINFLKVTPYTITQLLKPAFYNLPFSIRIASVNNQDVVISKDLVLTLNPFK